MSNSEFLKEMGIAEWVSRDQVNPAPVAMEAVVSEDQPTPSISNASDRAPQGNWWFFGAKPQGNAQVLFQNIIRVLGLTPLEWSWKDAAGPLNQLSAPDNGLPVVALAFGGPVAQKITGERDSLPQLRDTVLALNAADEEDIPVVATFELNQLLTRPSDKALFWQDLLLAKSVLQNS